MLVSDCSMQNIVLDEAVFIWKPNYEVEGIVCIHVDDFIWTGTDEFEGNVISRLMKIFKISRHEEGSFKYLGLKNSFEEPCCMQTLGI